MELERHLAQWHTLAKNALDANIFYEPSPFLAAINTFAEDWPFLCLFVYQKRPKGDQLIGFMPLLPARKGPGNHLRCYRSFTHLHCYLATPLIHRESSQEAVASIFNWFNNASGSCRLLGLYNIQADGGFAKILKQSVSDQPHVVEQSFERALITRREDPERYFSENLSRHRQKEHRRLWRRLEEKGTLTLKTYQNSESIDEWIDDFLILEASGWKGTSGAAMGNSPAHSDFFVQIVQQLATSGQLIRHSLHQGDRIIAMKCNLIAADGRSSFAFKIAFDESFARYSPGVLLELQNIEHLFCQTSLDWMDSCADPDHPMIDRLWRERRQISYILYGKKSLSGRLLMKLFRPK